MAFAPLTVTSDWHATTAQYTATEETPIGIYNPTLAPVRYILSATRPAALAVTDGFPLDPKGTVYLTMVDGEKLWLVAPGQPVGNSIVCTLMT